MALIIVTVVAVLLAAGGGWGETETKERMPLWDRIALADVPIYTSEGLDQQNPPQTAKKGSWARFIRHSAKFTTELVELESGGQFWVQDTAMLPLYYVVGTTPLSVQVAHGDKAKPVDPSEWTQEVIAYPGDVVAVDRWGQALSGTWLIYSPDGSKHGYASIKRLEPVGDAGLGLGGE